MTKAVGSLMVKHEEGDGNRRVEWVDSEEWQARRWVTLTVQSVRPAPGQLCHARHSPIDRKKRCFDSTLSRLFFVFCLSRTCCLHSLLNLFPHCRLPAVHLAQHPSHCAFRAAGLSLGSALECCFHITASGGMWSLF